MSRVKTVLYVEDEEYDRFFMRLAFEHAKVSAQLMTVPSPDIS